MKTLYNICSVIAIFLDLENIGLDTIFVKLSCIEPKILNKIGFSVMAALICKLSIVPLVGKNGNIKFFTNWGPFFAKFHI